MGVSDFDPPQGPASGTQERGRSWFPPEPAMEGITQSSSLWKPKPDPHNSSFNYKYFAEHTARAKQPHKLPKLPKLKGRICVVYP